MSESNFFLRIPFHTSKRYQSSKTPVARIDTYKQSKISLEQNSCFTLAFRIAVTELDILESNVVSVKILKELLYKMGFTSEMIFLMQYAGV